ncbi:TPA: DUF305 domain-containing protein, partial [Escherichia coli]|nr:DUF305 domain-containing protein [Escherichia coli]
MEGNMDMKSMMKDMNDKMSSMSMSGNPDVDFAMMMRIHHQGAIDMVQAELQAGKDPQMRKMATNVIKAQKKEIAELDKFLAKHGHSGETMKKVTWPPLRVALLGASRRSLSYREVRVRIDLLTMRRVNTYLRKRNL